MKGKNGKYLPPITTQNSFNLCKQNKKNFIEKNKEIIKAIANQHQGGNGNSTPKNNTLGSYMSKKASPYNSQKRCALSSSERYNNFMKYYKINILKEQVSRNIKDEITLSKNMIKEEPDEERTYYYQIISTGNDSGPVKNCFAHRINWKCFDSPELKNSAIYNTNTNTNIYNINNTTTNTNNIAIINNRFSFNNNHQNIILHNTTGINFIWAPLSTQIDFDEFSNKSSSYSIEEDKKDKELIKVNSSSNYNTYNNNSPLRELKKTNKEFKKMFNHFEFHQELSNKQKLFKNLMMYCENNGMDVFKYVPFTIFIEYESELFLNQYKSFTYVFKNLADLISDSENAKNLTKKYRSYFYVESETDQKLGSKTNLYIPKTHYDGQNIWLLKAVNLNRGRALKLISSLEECENYIKIFYQGGIYKNVKESQKKKDIENVDTNKKILFSLPKIVSKKNSANNNNKKESSAHKESRSKHLRRIAVNEDIKNANGCLYRKIDYYSLLKNEFKEVKKRYQSNKIILQKYIEKPLLYRGRKFDVRMWVLITHKMKVYVFKEGHLKATSYKYNVASHDSFVHLTNYSVQKYSQNFSKFEIGNEISFDDFQLSLKEDYNKDINVRVEIFKKICDLIWLSLKSVKKSINPNNRKGSFEIFGYDLMLDEELTPYIIEVNTNPGLEISSPLISHLVPRMIDDAFRLTLDKVFGTKYSADTICTGKYLSPYHVDGYGDDEIIYEFVGDLAAC